MNLFDIVENHYTRRDMTQQEEASAAVAAQAGDRDKALQLLCNYLPKLKKIVSHTYSRVAQTGLSQRSAVNIEDLRSAAVEGFFDALREFDPTHHRRVSAHLELAVRRRVIEARDAYMVIEVPHTMRVRFTQALEAADGNVTRGRELAVTFGLDPDTYDAIARAYVVGRARSLANDPESDVVTGTARVRTNEERMAMIGAPDLQREEDLVDAARALSSLDPRERLIVETLYGIGCEPHSVREAAAALGIPRTTIQRVVEKSIAHMRITLGA